MDICDGCPHEEIVEKINLTNVVGAPVLVKECKHRRACERAYSELWIYEKKEDLKLEYLYVGDYGKENNIKADFLGYTKRIEKVEHKAVDLTDKLVVTVSSQKGCSMDCDFCDCPKFGFYGNCSEVELISEITTAIALSGIRHGKRLNVHFARMGEPSFNYDVINSAVKIADMIKPGNTVSFDEYHPVVSTMMPKHNGHLWYFLHEWVTHGKKYGGADGFGLQFSINTLNENDRNKMFRARSLSLAEIGECIRALPTPGKRKYTLNFAVTGESDLSPALMDKFFDKEKCVVKITPIHETCEAVKHGYETVKNFDVYERFERPLVEAGWEVITFIPSEEEDKDRITCGNALIGERLRR